MNLDGREIELLNLVGARVRADKKRVLVWVPDPKDPVIKRAIRTAIPASVPKKLKVIALELFPDER